MKSMTLKWKKKMKDLKIKITGSGDKQMLVFALAELAAVIKATPTTKLENGVEWEDGILMTEISENEDDLPGVEYPTVTKVTKEDIIEVAKSLGITLTETELNWVLLCYEDAQRQDPSGTWNLVVEDLCQQAVEFRRKQEEADEESEETRRDFCNDPEDDIDINMGGQIV